MTAAAGTGGPGSARSQPWADAARSRKRSSCEKLWEGPAALHWSNEKGHTMRVFILSGWRWEDGHVPSFRLLLYSYTSLLARASQMEQSLLAYSFIVRFSIHVGKPRSKADAEVPRVGHCAAEILDACHNRCSCHMIENLVPPGSCL